MEIDRRYSDLGLGLVDGSVAALAESLASPPAMCVTSLRSGCVTAARWSWSSTRRTPIDPDHGQNPVHFRMRTAGFTSSAASSRKSQDLRRWDSHELVHDWAGNRRYRQQHADYIDVVV
jgi:hypothetical protein